MAPDRETIARRVAIAATLVRLGFISSAPAEPCNPAVDVLAALLPRNSEVGVCLSCHEFKSSGTYPFGETGSLFYRPQTGQTVSSYPSRWRRSVPTPRTEIVVCTKDALFWTRSRARIRGARAVGDDVTLYSVPFSVILGATVHDRRQGALEVWIDAGPTLSFHTTPSESDSLCSYIERAATSE